MYVPVKPGSALLPLHFQGQEKANVYMTAKPLLQNLSHRVSRKTVKCTGDVNVLPVSTQTGPSVAMLEPTILNKHVVLKNYNN